MNDANILMQLQSARAENKNEINRLSLQIEKLQGFHEAYNIAIDMIERGQAKERKP